MTYSIKPHLFLIGVFFALGAICAGCFGGCGGGSGSTSTPAAPEVKTVDVVVLNSQNTSLTVKAELALTQEEQATGLMYRTSMEDDRGMLFVYSIERTLSFWMKNTLIPLDMIFIRADGTIVDINENAQPEDLTPYSSSAPAKYVLEVNGGWCLVNKVETGNTVTIPDGY